MIKKMESIADAYGELVIQPRGIKVTWDVDIKCPFMPGFYDEAEQQRQKQIIFQYAIGKQYTPN